MTAITIIPTNVWTHIVAVRQNNLLRLYLNNSLDISMQELSPTNVSNTSQFKIGAFDDEGRIENYFEGLIDNVRIYNRALSESEIQELYYSH